MPEKSPTKTPPRTPVKTPQKNPVTEPGRWLDPRRELCPDQSDRTIREIEPLLP